MQKLLINGKKDLSGRISISGSKNATLPILAASILTDNCKLTNVPLVKDIFTMVELIKFIGVNVNIKKSKKIIELKLDADEQKSFQTSIDAVRELFNAAKKIDPSLA